MRVMTCFGSMDSVQGKVLPGLSFMPQLLKCMAKSFEISGVGLFEKIVMVRGRFCF